MSDAPTTNALLLVLKAIAGLCEELRLVRDDLMNHAAITAAPVVGAALPFAGQKTFAVADMPTGAAAVRLPLYTNNQNHPVVVLVQLQPNITTIPPAGYTFDQTTLLLSIDASGDATVNAADNTVKAHVIHTSAGAPVAVLLPNNASLSAQVLAGGVVTLMWKVIPLRGRRSLFPST